MKSVPFVCRPLFLRLLPTLVFSLAVALISGCSTPGKLNPPEPVAPAPSPPPISIAPIPPTPTPSPNPLPPIPVAGPRVWLGIDVLASQNFAILQGKRVGLLTHQPGVNRFGVSTIEVLRHAPGVNLVALYAPEHGLDGKVAAGQKVGNGKYQNTNLPVYSFYRPDFPSHKAQVDTLNGIDVMVVDLQDIGTRSYTFISTLRDLMEICFAQKKEIVVLDRPNPLGGLKVGGPIITNDIINHSGPANNPTLFDYVGAYPIPYVFGLTIGELAQMAKDTPGWLSIPDDVRQNGRLTVIHMRGWQRSMIWRDTGLTWVPTSPFVPTPESALGYSMTGFGDIIGKFEHGMDTPYPFRLLNYPGRKPADLAAALNALKLPGLQFVPMNYADKGTTRSGVYVQINNWSAVQPAKLGFEMMKLSAAWSAPDNPFLKPTTDQAHWFKIIVGSQAWWNEMRTKGKNANVDGFYHQWELQDAAFQEISKHWWLYPE